MIFVMRERENGGEEISPYPLRAHACVRERRREESEREREKEIVREEDETAEGREEEGEEDFSRWKQFPSREERER